MLGNYLKIAFRNFWKYKFISLINLAGLSLGIATAILAFLFIQDEFRTDRFHQKADRIYQVIVEEKNLTNGEIFFTEPQPYPLGPALYEDLPEVESFVRFYNQNGYIKVGNNSFPQLLVFADSSLFSIFDFPLLYGDSTNAINSSSSVAVSESKSEQLFGSKNSIGKRISVRLGNTFQDFYITAVFKDIPEYSSIQAEVIVPMHESILKLVVPNITQEDNSVWYASYFRTFVCLNRSIPQEFLSEKLKRLRAEYFPDEEVSLEDTKGEDAKSFQVNYHFRPLSEVYFSSAYLIGNKQGSKPIYSYILVSIAGCILLMACFNYLTLSIGRASRRTREIGIRKVVGARRRQIAYQFISESILLSIFSLGIALLLVGFLLPLFNRLAGKELSVMLFTEQFNLIVIVSITMIAGLLSGIYPAVYLSAIPTLDAFLKKFTLGRINLFTQMLVTFQFCLPVIFLVITLIMIHQLQYMRTQDLGFNEERVLVIENNAANPNQSWKRFQNWAENQPNIGSTAVTTSSFTKYNITFYFRDEKEKQQAVRVYFVSESLFETLGLPIEQGRWFNSELASDSTETIVVNEEFVRAFGWSDPIGKEIDGRRIIGVLKDFHLESLASAIPPVAFYLTQDRRDKRHILVKLSSSNLSRTIADLTEVWQSEISDSPFIYSFLDEDFDALYQQEERWRQIMQWVAGITIIIAVLGLIGLTALAAAGREKEVSIRKVLGASVSSILLLLSRDFLRLVIIALVISIPVANYLITEWLAGFAYRVEVRWWLFALPSGLILLIAILSVCQQTMKAASRNPVQGLRQE